ncbi:MAG: TetR/AcrR family transcriptional regulator [Actinomycetota bacterium]
MSEPAPKRARDIARAALIRDITDTARRHLAEQGAAGLSLRAVSRELGMVSSAIYRYFPSRDALLTQLIIEAYNALGATVETAEAEVERTNHAGRFAAVAHGVRNWARANPHEYALIYGSPVPGYAAPQDTIAPASRVTMLLLHLLADLDAAGAPLSEKAEALEPALRTQLVDLVALGEVDIDPVRMAMGIGVWTELYGMVSFELFGQFRNVFNDADAIFARRVAAMGRRMGADPS